MGVKKRKSVRGQPDHHNYTCVALHECVKALQALSQSIPVTRFPYHQLGIALEVHSWSSSRQLKCFSDTFALKYHVLKFLWTYAYYCSNAEFSERIDVKDVDWYTTFCQVLQ